VPIPRPRWRRARPHRRRRAIARSVTVVCLLAATTALAACGASGAAPHAAPSGDVHAYVDCLFSHMNDSGGTGPRKACQAQRPAAGIGPAVEAFASCLNTHGVVLPSQSPGTTVSDALRYLNQLRTGTTAQRTAFHACLSSVR
jgi:hypothetical protein